MTDFDYNLHIFRSPGLESIVNSAIRFFENTPIHILRIENFRCRLMILTQSDLIVPVEAKLIRTHEPLWNTVVDGFGNHDPGAGRINQARSEWDVLHPGRAWAERLTGKPPQLEQVLTNIRAFLTGSPLP